jgi:hypothetical protein
MVGLAGEKSKPFWEIIMDVADMINGLLKSA